ncbi:DUF7553 family protein [Halomicrobium katesii]|uniref:DUF7553 family protein n=1 Tax=Halomicrobium katesii TaxID=437163 RepID=UPI000378337F|nr:hypothetical protein [Halomicrobium katesii]
MDRHVEDTRYYRKRAGTTAKNGVTAELEPAVRRVRDLTGREAEPEPGRLESARADLAAMRERAEAAVEAARERIGSYRRTEA